MSDLANIRRARFEAVQARRRFASTFGTLQYRLKPGNLASTAWDDVREKGTAIAGDAVEAAKARPLVTGGIAAAIGLFLARKPIAKAAKRALDGDDEVPATDEFIQDWEASPAGVPGPISEGVYR